MHDDQAAILDSLLCEWHQWQQHERLCRGFAPRALVVGEYRISRQYDSENGALDDAMDHSRMRDLDFQVSEMADPWRAAIYVNALALVVGVKVFTSPRLPQDRAEREAVVRVARQQLSARLVSCGVL